MYNFYFQSEPGDNFMLPLSCEISTNGFLLVKQSLTDRLLGKDSGKGHMGLFHFSLKPWHRFLKLGIIKFLPTQTINLDMVTAYHFLVEETDAQGGLYDSANNTWSIEDNQQSNANLLDQIML